MMLGTVRAIRHRSPARVSRGWLVRGAHHERETPEPSIAYRLHANELVATFRTSDGRRCGTGSMPACRSGWPCMTVTGHKTRSVFDRYHIVSPTDLQDVARRLDAAGTFSGTSAPEKLASRSLTPQNTSTRL